MTQTEASTPVEDEPAPEKLAEAGVYATAEEGFEHGLVALAMGEAYWLSKEESGYRLRVEPVAVEAVREQLRIFDRESVGWPPVQPCEEAKPEAGRWTGRFLALGWVLVTLAAYRAQSVWPGLTSAGVLEAEAVYGRGEVWRAVTALFLHADVEHLVTNLAGGGFLFWVVFGVFGWWRGAAGLALAAVAGNLAAAGLYYPGHYASLGASTAVFAGLGLLTGRALRRLGQSGVARPWRVWLRPLGAGITVLMLFGAGEVRVDVLAHATGFAAGLAAGVCLASMGGVEHREGQRG